MEDQEAQSDFVFRDLNPRPKYTWKNTFWYLGSNFSEQL